MKEFYNHYSGLKAAKDGELLVPETQWHKEKRTFGWKHHDGYRYIMFNGITYPVHRIILETFTPKDEWKEEIDHINTIKDDNRLDNLRWCTHKENCNNPLTIEKNRKRMFENPIKYWEGKCGEGHPMYGKHHSDESKKKMSESRKGKMTGTDNPNSKPIIGINKTTGEKVSFSCAAEAYRVLGISNNGICSCLKGRSKSAGGWTWHYA